MTVDTALRVRVAVTPVWDTVRLEVAPDWTVARLKEHALREATGRRRVDPGAFQVKFRGALVLNEDQTLADLGVPDGGALIVLPARRQPVR